MNQFTSRSRRTNGLPVLACLAVSISVVWMTAAGCDRGGNGNANPPSGNGINIDWGSGSVNIGGDGSVDVQAPGVDVQRKPGDGVSVRAPNVSVDASPQSGVQVQAPGVDVRTE
ncbi:MAG: hypothetical protein AAF670_11665 [Planctomycetota bacterium]